VPNAALRWSPRPWQIARDDRREGRGRSGQREHDPNPAEPRATLWLADGELVRPLPVKAGLSDGTFTEVEGRGLTEALPVVVGEGLRLPAAPAGVRNPFAPQPFRQAQRTAQAEGQGEGGPGQPPGAGR